MTNRRQQDTSPTTRSSSANRLQTTRRRTTFAFVMACLFSGSASLSSSSSPRRKISSVDTTPISPSAKLNGESSGSTRRLDPQLASPSLNSTSAVRNQRLIPQNDKDIELQDSFRHVRRAVLQELRDDNNFEGAKIMICGMLEYLQENFSWIEEKQNDTSTATKRFLTKGDHRDISETIDESLQAFYARAFAQPLKRKQDFERVRLGSELLQMQLKDEVMAAPFDTVPKGVIVQALAAVTTLQERRNPSSRQQRRQHIHVVEDTESSTSPDVAFRLLQRLVTGVGIRSSSRTRKNKENSNSTKGTTPALKEVDFNRVLNVYSNLGKMDMAHRVIALQERTPHAPSLSPVTYSILVKGYGKLGDWNNIDTLLQHAAASEEMLPDTILFNSLMDAYINCNQLDKARTVFDAMINAQQSSESSSSLHSDDFPFAPQDCPAPNLRSYNTLLKGLAKRGHWEDARRLATDMKERLGLWDHVTTNTLVHAAVESKDFDSAEEILSRETLERDDSKSSQHRNHPNADAYTSLMDGYSKNGKLDKAIALLKIMSKRGVEPNDFHFASLIGGLARQKRTQQAQKLLTHVKSLNIPKQDQRVIYNAFISGLVQSSDLPSLIDENYNQHVDEAVGLLRNMVGSKIRPDVNTVAMILDGFGHCQPPRLVESVTLMEKLERERIIPQHHSVVATALIRVFAAAGDMEGATKAFQRIKNPDTVAINAFLDAAVRCGKDAVAMKTFDSIFRSDSPRATPDVISYSTLISANMKKGSMAGSRAARDLYNEMRFQRRIFPDKALVDIIVRAMVENSRTSGIQAVDARFVAGALRDAEELNWGEGQLAQRKRAVEFAMRKNLATAWDEEATLYGLRKDNSGSSSLERDEVFQRHGWNLVDSGFQLWGAGRSAVGPSAIETDAFLKSKGWNDMDSGFKII